jgi:NADH-quinone oxidoreductase subunit J
MIANLNVLDLVVIGIVLVLCLLMLLSKKIVTVLTAFFAILLLVALIFLISGSGFLFITQLLIYVAGVSILFVFAIMLSKRLTNDRSLVSENQNLVGGLLVSALVLGVLLLSINKEYGNPVAYRVDEVRIIGVSLVNNYLFAFELLAIFLLIALILASVIAGKKENR